MLAILLFSKVSMTTRGKVCIGGLRIEDFNIKYEFCIFGTEENAP